jgi:hypothetical protein
LKAEINSKLALSAECVLSRFQAIATTTIEDVANFDGDCFSIKSIEDWPEGAASAVASVKGHHREKKTKHGYQRSTSIEITFESKLTACRALGEHLGMFDGYEKLVKTADSYEKKLVDTNS